MTKRVHFFAIATAAATWLLLMIGCMVHGTGSSLACPDWPTCYGTFFPEMKNGVEYEHTHRLVATAVGLMTLILAGLAWRASKKDPSPKAKTTAKLGFLAAFLVIAQGVLGGITVLYQLPIGVTLAHLCTSVSFFSLLVYIALRTREAPNAKAWRGEPPHALVAVGGFLTLGQILMGGIVRHTHNGLACFNVLICEKGAWPDRLGQKIQMSHRYIAVFLAAYVVIVAWTIFKRSEKGDLARKIAVAQVALIATQIGLGLWSVWKSLPLYPITLHLGCAALILVSHVILYVRFPRAAAEAPISREHAGEAVHA